MVECNLAKVEVAGSNPVSRSTNPLKSFRLPSRNSRSKRAVNPDSRIPLRDWHPMWLSDWNYCINWQLATKLVNSAVSSRGERAPLSQTNCQGDRHLMVSGRGADAFRKVCRPDQRAGASQDQSSDHYVAVRLLLTAASLSTFRNDFPFCQFQEKPLFHLKMSQFSCPPKGVMPEVVFLVQPSACAKQLLHH